MSKNSRYAGAARFIELAPPGIQFRGLTNVDHITSISFANKVEEIEIDAEGDTPAHTEQHVTGFTVGVGIAGQLQEFTFAQMGIGVAFYNDLLDMIAAVGIPCQLKPRIMPPPRLDETSEIVGPDGKVIKAAIEAGYEGEDLEDPMIDELEDLVDEMTEDQIKAEDNNDPTTH